MTERTAPDPDGVADPVEEARFQSLLDDLPLIVWVHDQHGDQVFVNTTYCRFFGVTREEMKRDRWRMLTEPDSNRHYIEAWTAAVAEQGEFHAEITVRNGAGEWRTLESWAAPRFDDDGRFLGHVGTSADVTDTRAALLAEHEARQRAEILERTATQLAVAPGAREVAAAVVSGLAASDVGPMTVCTGADDRLRVLATSDTPGADQFLQTSFPLTEDRPLTNAFRSASVVEFADGAEFDRRHPDLVTWRGAIGFESLLVVPIVDAEGESLAVLGVTSPHPGWFTEARRGLLEVVALQAGGAFERALQREREQRLQERATFISAALSELDGLRTVREQLGRLAHLLVPELVDFVSIESPDEADPLLVVQHEDPETQLRLTELRRRFSLANDGSNALAERHALEPIVTTGVADDAPNDSTRDLLDRIGIRSQLAVPLSLGELATRGALVAGITDPERTALDDDDLEFFLDLTQRLGAVLASTASQERDQAISIDLQRSLLPREVAVHPSVDVVAHYNAGDERLEIGGDWYDTFTWPSGHYAIVVGDMVGHGIDSAIAMGRLRAGIEAVVADLPPVPGPIIDAIDRLARRLVGPGFLTVTCAVIDPSTRTLAYGTAGHPPGLLVRDGRAIWLDGAGGGPICAVTTERRGVAAMQLEADDLLFFYSDGLIERRRRTLDEGFDRLERAVLAHATSGLEHLSHSVLDEMGGDGEDDVVIVAARFDTQAPRLIDRLSPRKAELAAARRRLRHWLDSVGSAEDTTITVLLAAGEAITNAMDHSGCTAVVVRAMRNPSDGWIQLSVNDDGAWSEPPLYPTRRGRGLSIMETAATALQRVSDPTGTSILLTFADQPTG